MGEETMVVTEAAAATTNIVCIIMLNSMYLYIDDRFTDERTKNRMNRIRSHSATLFFDTIFPSIPWPRENNCNEIVKTIDFCSVEIFSLVLWLWHVRVSD